MLPHRAPSVVPTSLDFSDGSYLAALLKQVVADLGKYKDRGAITDDTPEAHGLCFVLEKIFLHELKTGPRGNFWEFVERLQDSLPGNQAAGMLDKLRNWTRSSTGRGRAFLRLSLNQHTVVEYLQALVWNTGLLRAFYTQGAFFRNEHLVTEMMEQLELVLPLQFSLTMHFAEIDREDYWNAHRREIEDLHIRVISGRESEFKFGLLSVEGDERRRREQVRKRTGSLTRDNGNGTDPRLDMWENSEAERTGSSGSTATNTRRGSLPPASTTPPPVAIAPTPTTAPEKEIERNAEAAGRVEAKEKAMREVHEAKKKKEAEEEEERKRGQEEAEKREENERRMKEEAERQRLEDEERTVLEEARRLEEELAWRRKQREMARKKARGSERRQRQREQAQADEKAAGEGNGHSESETAKAKAMEQKAEDEERKGEEKAVSVAQLESRGDHRDAGTTKNEGDEGSESESDKSDRTRGREGSIEIRVTGVAEAGVLGTESSGGSGAEEEEEAAAAVLDRSGGSTASALLQVEKMLRELEERRLKLLQDVHSPTTTEHAFPAARQQLLGSSEPDAAKSGAEEPVVIDSLLRDLNLTELDSLEEVLDFCEELDDDGRNGSDRPNKNTTSAAMAMTGRRTTLDVAPEAATMMSKSYHERAQHLDEVLRFCDELDEALVGVEFEQTQEQRLRKLAAAGKSTDRLLSSSPGLPFLASSSFKREGVWASMHSSADDDDHHPRRQRLLGAPNAAAPALSVTPGKLDYLKSKLSSSPKKEMLLFHLQQKRAERELRAGGAMAQAHQAAKPQQPPAEPFAIEKESPAKNFSRGRTGSLLSQNLEASLATASSSSNSKSGSSGKGGGLSKSTPSTPIRGGVTEVVVKPALGPHKNYRNSYYSSLKLHSPSLPSPSDMAAVQARNSELRRVRSIEREQRQQQRQASLRGAPPSASVGNARERTALPPRRQLDFERDPALTASGRSVTIGALGSAANKKTAVMRKASAPAPAVAVGESTSNSGDKRLSGGSGGSEASGAVDAPTKAKLQRPIWARDSEHTNCGLCDATFSLVVRRHHCRVCGQIFCSKCCEKTTVPDLEYDTPVPVCQLCYTALPPPPSGPSTATPVHEE